MSINNLRDIKITPFQKNILTLFKGTLSSQIIGVVGALFLAKIYGSEAYGIFGLYISISGVLTIIYTLQLDKSIITIKNKKESENLMNSLFFITLFIALFFTIIYSISFFFFELNLIKTAIVISGILASIIFSFNKIHESFFTYRKVFKPISNAKILVAFFNIIFQLLLFQKFKLMGLIYGNIISITIITLYYFYKNRSHIIKINLKQLKKSVVLNNTILKFIFPSTLINSLAINVMPILIVTFFSLEDAGVYFLSLKIVAIPLALISSSISQVYFQKSSEMLHTSKEKLFGLTKKIVFTNLGIMLFSIIFINTIGIYFLELYFGKSWGNLRLFTFILSFLIIARSSFNPISHIIIVLHKNHISLIFNSYLFLANLGAIYIGYISNNIVITLILFSILGSIGYLTLLIYFLNELKKLKRNHE